MLAKWGSQTRMTAAKDILSDIVDSLSANSAVELALRVYGHQYPRERNVCNDTRLEVPFGKNNHGQIIARLNAIKPKGNTPITYSLEKASGDFPTDKTYRNIIILITDGIESCQGDPCATSLSLQKKSIFLKPFIIGLGMAEKDAHQFDCIGQFIDARNRRELHDALEKSVHNSLDKTTVTVELLDAKGNKKISNVNVTFINNFTKLPTYEFIHYRDRNGRPDTVEIDGILSYDVVVNTIPPVTKRNVSIESGQHNTISIKAPQGTLSVSQPNTKAYDHDVSILIRDPKSKELYNVQSINEKHNYLVGNYDVEILTLPRVKVRNVHINQDKTTSLGVDDPGLLNLKMTASGYGSLYEIKKNGSEEWIYNIPKNQSSDKIVLQPGNYKAVFRAKNASGSKYTATKIFKITSGSSINITLFN